MDIVKATQGFSAMGSEPRMEVLQTLVKAGEDGLLVGGIQQRTGMPASTLAHHLKFLASAGLVQADKKGRTITNRTNFDHLKELAAFILEECCADMAPPND